MAPGKFSAAVFFILAAWLPAQTLDVTPSRVMADEAATIHAAGLQPSEHVIIHAELIDGGDHRWVSQAEFAADVQGAIDVSQQAPVAGSYKEISAMGLLWSMMPEKTPGEKHEASYQAPKQLGPQTIDFRLLRNGQSQPLATARLEQITLAEGVRQIPVHDGDLRGILFLPATKEPRPGVMVLGGSEGGVPRRQAAWLAAHGYAALALAYFRYEDLPSELAAIPLEYFGHAVVWMMKRPEIQPEHIAVMGSSRGGELALQVGSMYQPIRAVVAYVPASVRYPSCCGNRIVPYAWTWKGQPIAFIPAHQGGNPLGSKEAMAAAIHVEETQGPVLMISGEDDHLWPSAMMADAVVSRLKRLHFAYSFENLKYPHAGHYAGHPHISPTWHSEVLNRTSNREMDLGGSPRGDAFSTLDSIPKVLEFLRQALGQPK